MRIERLMLKNYRQYKELDISIGNDDLCVIIGKMGMGKSNLLNSINWCLYQKEPYLSSDSEGLPILNLKTIDENEDDTVQTVVVELWTKNENQRIIFTREAEYVVHNDKGKAPTLISKPEFEAKISDEFGNFEPKKGEDASALVERFVPAGISEYFFFDGERLNIYFKEATGQRIRNSIYQISQTQLLGDIEGNLSTIIKELEKDVGKQNPKVEETRVALENKERDLKNKDLEIQECTTQINIAEEKIAEYKDKLKEIPDIDKMEKEQTSLINRRKSKKDSYKKRVIEKQNLLFKYGKLIMAYPAVNEIVQVIKTKKENKELPPTTDDTLIKNILINSKECICGTKILAGSEQEEKLQYLLNDIEITSEVGRELQTIDSALLSMHEDIHEFENKIKDVTIEINEYLKEIDGIEEQIELINFQIGGYNKKKISLWHKKMRENEDLHKQNLQNLGVLKDNKIRLEIEIKDLREKRDEEIKKDAKFKDLKMYIDFAEKAKQVAKESKDEIMDKIRNEISDQTSKNFLELHWKSETFESVNITDDFEFLVNHIMGYPCLGTLSGGERCVLALSFTMALHKVSGFDSPILIDRPLAMASGEPIGYIADILTKLATEKQTILLLTPDDNRSVSEYWDDVKSSSKYAISMSEDEKSAKLEVF